MSRRDDTLDERLRRAYLTAVKAATEGTVGIHLAQDVWDYLRSFLTPYGSMNPPPPPNMIWGYTLLLEAAWEPGRIEVRTTIQC